MNEQEREAKLDHESDPAHTPGHGWVDEGGASHLGPATHLTHEDDASDTEESVEADIDED